MEAQTLSLYDLNALVHRSISTCLPDEYWVQAELSDVRSNATGHCYLEFIQKDVRSNNLIAKARGTIWVTTWRLLKPYFEERTGQAFASGIKVQVRVRAEFHELYGYSLTVTDIDPTYTLGDLAHRRREILRQLEEEGVLSLNKELTLNELPQRIAVISSVTAAGYGDFCHQLHENAYGITFYPHLFPALMQGEQVEESVIAALNQIYKQQACFDAVVIIRGGGASSDLSGFDTYLLAANCAQFPLPLITGIGHERDDTVLDCVAHTRVKTPTAAAQFLINRAHDAAERLRGQVESLECYVSSRMVREQTRMETLNRRLPLAVKNSTLAEKHRMEQIEKRLGYSLDTLLKQEKYRLELIEQQASGASPERLLRLGYSITTLNGRAVVSASQLKPGDRLLTRLLQGEVHSEVFDEVRNN